MFDPKAIIHGRIALQAWSENLHLGQWEFALKNHSRFVEYAMLITVISILPALHAPVTIEWQF